MGKPLALVLPLLIGVLVQPAPAEAQSVIPCSGAHGYSEVSKSGAFGIGEVEVVELESEVDGTVIQVGSVRPDAPKNYRSPVIVHASPYFLTDLRDVDIIECNPFLVSNFVPHGYTVAFVPTRGNTDSCADLMGPKERADLDQAVTWLGTRKWSNGNVGMTGASYDGSTPWEVASMGNFHLKTIAPVSGVHNLFDLVYQRGRNDWRWWLFVPGYYHYYGLLLSNPVGGRDADRFARSIVCDTTGDGMGATVESYLTNEYDRFGYWAERNMDPDILKRYRGSVLLVQGLQDWNVDPGHQYPFVGKLERRGLYVKHLLGQWAHAFPDSRHNKEPRGDYADMLLRWWNRWLKNDRSVNIGPRVEVQDSDFRWRRETAWPPSDSVTRKLYFSVDDTLSNSPQDGEATALLGPGSRNRYFFLSDNTTVYNDAPIDHFCATCVMLSRTVKGKDLRIVGIPEVRVRVTPTGPRGFVSAYMFRVDPDGGWHLLGWGMGDVRFPNAEHEPQAVTPGEEMKLRFPLEPLDGVVHEGDQLLLVLDQGHADHMPLIPFSPVLLRYGQNLGVLRFETTQPAGRDFFAPPKLGG